jgi:hypothetical protein
MQSLLFIIKMFTTIILQLINNNMGNELLYFFIWFVVVMLILWFCPNDKIRLMGEFFGKVLPKIPFTGLAKLLKNKGDR